MTVFEEDRGGPAFDELLTEILRGETSLDFLLERYPEHARDLRELVQTALHMQELPMKACPEAESEPWRRVQEAVRETLLAAVEVSGQQRPGPRHTTA